MSFEGRIVAVWILKTNVMVRPTNHEKSSETRMWNSGTVTGAGSGLWKNFEC
jgi:hypothetical protein